MKSELVIKAEQEAREACEGLDYTEQQIQEFIDMHVDGELRREAEKEKELASAKRSKELNNALVEITRSQLQAHHRLRRYAPRYDPHNPDELILGEPHGASLGYSAEDKRDADTYQRQRNRGET